MNKLPKQRMIYSNYDLYEQLSDRYNRAGPVLDILLGHRDRVLFGQQDQNEESCC
jgi:hypothetical protein